jgi:hypothetical protein
MLLAQKEEKGESAEITQVKWLLVKRLSMAIASQTHKGSSTTEAAEVG